MSDEDGDNGEERVTMPFKFVTAGTSIEPFDTPKQGLFRRLVKLLVLGANPVVVLGFDARFPNMNQTKHCWQNYVDYHKCINARGEEFAPCRQFLIAFRSLCPSVWINRWDDQREKGIFPTKLDA